MQPGDREVVQRDGVLRIDRERRLVGGDRLRQRLAALGEDVAERRVGVGVVGVELDRSPRGGQRPGVVAGHVQRAGERHVAR